MGRRKKEEVNREHYKDGEPCPEEGCDNTRKRTPCKYCGRTHMRGEVIIEDRTGNVYLERLWDTEIKLHNELPPKKQKKHILRLWRSPNKGN